MTIQWPQVKIVDKCKPEMGPMMIRYYLSPRIFGVRLVLHKFLRSDNDRAYHDHPWNYISWIVAGEGYWENQPDGSYWRPRWSIQKRSKYHKHWVGIFTKGVFSIKSPVWTIALLYGKRRDWGFWTDKGWIVSDKYECP